jgi:hypothetical protein
VVLFANPSVFAGQGTFKVWDLVPARAGVAHCLMSFRLEGLTGVLAPEQFDFIPYSCGILTGNHKLGHYKVRTAGAVLCVAVLSIGCSPQPVFVSDTKVVPLFARYNPLQMKFMTAAEGSLRVCECHTPCLFLVPVAILLFRRCLLTKVVG